MESSTGKELALKLLRDGHFGPETPHRGVFQRIVALIGNAEVRWCGGDLRPGDDGLLSGRIWFVTDRAVVVADVTKARPHDESPRGDSEGLVDVQVVARRTIKSIATRDGEGPAAKGAVWTYLGEADWPNKVEVELDYEALPTPLVVRMQDITGDFPGLIEAVMKDLSG
jgi:hypothetical protein